MKHLNVLSASNTQSVPNALTLIYESLKRKDCERKTGRGGERVGKKQVSCFVVSAGVGWGSGKNILILNYTGEYWYKFKFKALLKLKENHPIHALGVKPLWFWFNVFLPFCFGQLSWILLLFLKETSPEFCRLVGAS